VTRPATPPINADSANAVPEQEPSPWAQLMPVAATPLAAPAIAPQTSTVPIPAVSGARAAQPRPMPMPMAMEPAVLQKLWPFSSTLLIGLPPAKA